ncbi:MAG: pyridoxamine 5'-phosphate oxidase family protein, partial [Anaerolineales bacterium]|nr:pyridoxamine 5'-phosphate oxidase family protein [Anaerolineales bacterium]
MPDEKPASPASVRRKDRAKDDVWIRELLQRAPFGVLATVSEGQPFVNSNLFVYAEAAHAIYVHTAHVGRTPANIECEERVCFSVSEMGRMLPAEHALKFSVEYAGVTVFGRARVLSDAEEKRYGLQLLLDKYFPHLRSGRDYRAITD